MLHGAACGPGGAGIRVGSVTCQFAAGVDCRRWARLDTDTHTRARARTHTDTHTDTQTHRHSQTQLFQSPHIVRGIIIYYTHYYYTQGIIIYYTQGVIAAADTHRPLASLRVTTVQSESDTDRSRRSAASCPLPPAHRLRLRPRRPPPLNHLPGFRPFLLLAGYIYILYIILYMSTIYLL